MATKINISIPQPCHENWQAITPTEKGRFCDSCQKNVFDFTSVSDRQIIEVFNKNQNLCGQFTSSQLNRDLVIPKEKSSIWLATTSAIVSLLGFGNQQISAQETPKTEQTDKKVITDNSNSVTSNQEREISGVVSDETGPLPGANVVIKGTTRGTQTDVDGEFSINAKQNDILEFSFLGMETVELIIKESNSYKIKMKDAVVGNMDVIITTGLIIKKRTFFGRIFHKIRNLFR